VYGCLGFLTEEYWFIAFVPYGILASVLGSAGYIFSLIWYKPAVTANVYLLEPFLAQVLGYLYGLDQFPGYMTIGGTILSVVGIYQI
jgi:drug/metabolite transporter (DMT)-like permease